MFYAALQVYQYTKKINTLNEIYRQLSEEKTLTWKWLSSIQFYNGFTRVDEKQKHV